MALWFVLISMLDMIVENLGTWKLELEGNGGYGSMYVMFV